MRRIVVQMLKRLGYADITEANDGKEALAILQGGVVLVCYSPIGTCRS